MGRHRACWPRTAEMLKLIGLGHRTCCLVEGCCPPATSAISVWLVACRPIIFSRPREICALQSSARLRRRSYAFIGRSRKEEQRGIGHEGSGFLSVSCTVELEPVSNALSLLPRVGPPA